MNTPLVPVSIMSIYKNKQGVQVGLPKRMASATPDMAQAIYSIDKELAEAGGRLVLSDLFRSYEMQMQSHMNFKSGKKKAFSPEPGGSFHEAGRAMDISLNDLKINLKDFWRVAKKYNITPIISTPSPSKSESWHFECRGSHQVVIDYYKDGFGDNFSKPYTAGTASAILAAGIRVDAFGKNQKEARIQAALVRMGYKIGNIDGEIGAKTRAVLKELGVESGLIDDILLQIEDLVQLDFLSEYRISKEVAEAGSLDWQS